MTCAKDKEAPGIAAQRSSIAAASKIAPQRAFDSGFAALRCICYFALLAWAICFTALAQSTSRTLYQISSGIYTMAGGIWGELEARLPNPDQAFVLLTVDRESGRADLTLLGKDQRTVFLSLTNGVMANSVITFECEVAHPYPEVPERGTLNYTVVQTDSTLQIEGSMTFPPVCCDIPHLFAHTKVVANQVPSMSIRVSEIEICWNSVSNCTYQVQYRSDLGNEPWTNLGEPIQGNGTVICTVDKIPQGEPQRLYRIILLP